MLTQPYAATDSPDSFVRTSFDRPHPATGGLPGYRLRRVLDHIASHVTDDLTVAELAELVGMSPHHFAALFKRSTGVSPHQFVLLHRIERARELLCDSRCSILDAALDAGFNNASHFARTFRRFVGFSPSTFRAYVVSLRCSDRTPASVQESPHASRHIDAAPVR
jgi:transcriptional regulator GlxA family with amidase domain